MQLPVHRLHTRLVLAATLAMVMATLGLAFWTTVTQSEQLLASRMQQAELLADNVAEGSAHSYVLEDYAALDHFLRQTMGLPGMRRIVATDPRGSVLSSFERTSDGDTPRTVTDGPAIVAVPQAIDGSAYQSGSSLVVWKPVMVGSHVGWLQVVYSLDEIDAMQRQIWRQGGILSLVEVAFGIALFVLLLNRPIGAIKALSRFARDLPLHRGATICVDKSVAEVRDLNESLNYASLELARSEQELRQLNLNLQAQVEQEVAKSREKDALLLQQARYQTLGELLVNIAHHWRQPLNSIGAQIQEHAWLIAHGELAPEQALAKAEEVMVTLQELSHSLEGFRQLCQPAHNAVYFLPSKAVAAAAAIVSEGFRLQQIEIRQEVVEEQPVYGPQHELVQVLLNLFNNARDAMLHNKVEHGLIRVQITMPGVDQVRIEVLDNGGGIPPQVQSTLFDPYVTTKFRAQGVGLGLFVVRQLVEQRFYGTVEANNNGDGARLTLTIPVLPGGVP